jgi:predicted ATPase
MIKRIRIRDFKSIRELDLELDPVTVLVGRSGTGKSNLVQAIRFLRNYLLNPQEAVSYEFGWARIIPVGENEPKTLIEVTFSVPGEERDYNYQISFQKRPGHGDPSLQAESLRLGNECLFSREFGQEKGPTTFRQGAHWHWQTPPKVALQPGFAETPMLASFPSLQQVVFAYAALSTGIGYYHLPSTVLGIARGPEHGQQFLQAVPGLSDNASNYREVMRGITQDFRRANIRKSLLASLQAVNPGIASIELDSLTNPQRAIIAHKAGDRVFELSLEQESDGLRRFYAHLLALYQNPSKLTLVFEEPENAIFPGALSLLAEEFQATAREERGQVILTTHNPIFLDSFDVDNIRAVEMREGATVVGRVSKEQRQAVKDRLLTTGELLTVDRARLDDEAKPQQAA